MRRSILAIILLSLTVAWGCSPSVTVEPAPIGEAWLEPPPTTDAAADTSDADPAAGDLAETLTLPDLIAFAVAHNPRIDAARHRWLAMRERSGQVTLPDLQIDYTYFVQPTETRDGPTRYAVRVGQVIPWPGRLSAAAAAFDADAEAWRYRFEATVRDVIAEVTTAYHELAYLHAAASVVTQNADLMQQLADLGEAQSVRETGDEADALTPSRPEVALIDVLNARSKVAQLTFDQVTIAERREAVEANLRSALGLADDAPVGLPRAIGDVHLTADLPTLTQLALTHRQEILAAAARVDAAGRRADAAQLRRLPDVMIGGTWTVIGRGGAQPVSGAENDAVGLSVGLRLPIWGGVQASVDEAAHQSRAERADGEAMARNTVAALSETRVNLRRAERLVTLYRDTLLPQVWETQQRLGALQPEGEATIGERIEAQALHLNFQLALARARADCLQGIAMLERLCGTSLREFIEPIASEEEVTDGQ